MYLDLEADDTFCDTAGIRVFGPVSGKTGRASAEAEATWHIVKAIPGPDEVVLRSLK